MFRPVNSASLAAFRILFGLLNAFGLARFWYLGWIERCFTEPQFLFKYPGFSWVQLWPGDGIYVHFAVMIVVSLCFAAGLLTRMMSVLFFLGFAYIELLDMSNYLNHYYLVSLLSFVAIFVPMNARWSLDNLLGLRERQEFVPAWTLNWVRGQVATVYFFAGLAKFGHDWLLNAQPLNIWLTASGQVPVIGPWLGALWIHYVMSWAGFLFDLTIAFWMMNARTRPFAFVAIVIFHFMTYLLFPIGMFPLIMVLSALIFFSPEWPLRLGEWARWWPSKSYPVSAGFAGTNPRRRGFVVVSLILYFSLQWMIPLRHFLYPGDVLWSEEGMRFSWKVMVREKNADVDFRVQDRKTGRQWHVSPSQYLARHQEAEMSGTPDMILQFAHFLCDQFKSDGLDVAVYADTLASFNGRNAQPLVDPQRDLTRETESWRPKDWILPAPQSRPHTLAAKRL